MSALDDFINDISQGNRAFIESLRNKYPDQVVRAIEIYGDGPSGWTFQIAGNARGLWEHQDPRYSNKEEFKRFVAEDFERVLRKLEEGGMPSELIDSIFELGEIQTTIAANHGRYEGYGHLRREIG